MSIVTAAERGFQAADLYDRYRPSFPDKSVQRLLERLKVAGLSKARIVDLAAGTGKLTALLAGRREGYEVIAVEPHASMRKVLEAKGLENVKVVEGTATNMPIKNSWADAVIVAQAFHWFSNMEALQEIHRILAPGSPLGLIWNVDDYNARLDSVPITIWEGRLKEIVWSRPEMSPRYRHNQWPNVFDEQWKSTPATMRMASPFFSVPLKKEEEKWRVWLSKQAVWERFRTLSHVSVLEDIQLEKMRTKVWSAMDSRDAILNAQDEIELHGTTIFYWTTAIDHVLSEESGWGPKIVKDGTPQLDSRS